MIDSQEGAAELGDRRGEFQQRALVSQRESRGVLGWESKSGGLEMRGILKSLGAGAIVVAIGAVAISCAPDEASRQPEQEQNRVAANLENFDDLDFNVFSNQKWTELHRSHSQDVIVHWPDGHTTTGIDQHIEDLKAMFVWAPDTRITVHPIKVGQDDWTAVIGEMEGTFTKPMPLPDGTSIPPTGKAYKIRMATFSHWTKDGPMDEEYLFWDNQEFMRQIGLGM